MDNPDYPNQVDMAIPILQFIAEKGGAISLSGDGYELEQSLADYYGMTDEQRHRTHPSVKAKGHRVWRNHIQFARAKMVTNGTLSNEIRNQWSITSRGYARLSSSDPGTEGPEHIAVARSRFVGTVPLISDLEESTFPEGKVIYRRHRHLERDSRIVRLAKQMRLNLTGRLECDVCEFDFFACYGDVGRGFIEAHHTKPVSELKGIKKTLLTDLALVCSNCHRMLHRRRPWLNGYELKKLLQE